MGVKALKAALWGSLLGMALLVSGCLVYPDYAAPVTSAGVVVETRPYYYGTPMWAWPYGYYGYQGWAHPYYHRGWGYYGWGPYRHRGGRW